MSRAAEIVRVRSQGYVTVKCAARAIGRHPSNVYAPYEEGNIEGVKPGSHVYVKWSSIIAWVNRNDPRAAEVLGLSTDTLPDEPEE